MSEKLSDLNVLIVEEQSHAGALLREMVRSAGAWKVELAQDCWQGRRYLNNDGRDVNLMIYDWDSDSPAGREFLMDLRCCDRPPLILMISSGHDAAEVRKAIDHGASAFVVKPFTCAQLQVKLRGLADRIAARSAAALV